MIQKGTSPRNVATAPAHHDEQDVTGEPITFAPMDDVLADLTSVPGINDDHAEREAARSRMEQEYSLSLAMVRHAAELTQADVAAKLGTTQTSVSRLEGRSDMLLSTLRGYLDAAGAAHPRILVTIAGVEHEIELDAFK